MPWMPVSPTPKSACGPPPCSAARWGRNLTADSFIAAMEGMGEVAPSSKFVAKYGPKNHNGASYVELAIVDQQGNLRY